MFDRVISMTNFLFCNGNSRASSCLCCSRHRSKKLFNNIDNPDETANTTYNSDDEGSSSSSADEYYEFSELQQQLMDNNTTTPVRGNYGIQRSPFADNNKKLNAHDRPSTVQMDCNTNADYYYGNDFNYREEIDDASSSSSSSSEVLIPAPPSPNTSTTDELLAQDSSTALLKYDEQMDCALENGDFSEINHALQTGRWDGACDEGMGMVDYDDDDSASVSSSDDLSVVSDISMQSIRMPANDDR